MQNIAFFDAKSYEKKIFDKANKKHNFKIIYLKERLTKDSVKKAKGCKAACVFVEDDVNKQIIDGLLRHGVKLIALRSAGYNNVDLNYAKGRIKVVRVPAYSPCSVAEHAMALILSLNRKIHLSYLRSRTGNFSLEGMVGFDLCAKTLGIIGTGKIGRIMVNIANGFNMKVLAYDLHPDQELEKQKKCSYVSLKELLKKSDIISLHCPLTKKNQHMINKKTIEQMKNGVIIINTGRGKLIKTEDLIKALKSNKIAGAGLDVYEEESRYFYHDYSTSIITDDQLARLIFFPNVLLTSHQGFFTKEALKNISQTTLQNVDDYFQKKPLKNEVSI